VPILCKQESLVPGYWHRSPRRSKTLRSPHAELRRFERNTYCAHSLLQIGTSNSAQAGEAIIDSLLYRYLAKAAATLLNIANSLIIILNGYLVELA
jgi:hypothetical protein